MGGAPVQLYIYDLSRGMAAAMSEVPAAESRRPGAAVPRRFYGKALIDYMPTDGSDKIVRGTTVEIVDSPEIVLSPVTTFWNVTNKSWPMMVKPFLCTPVFASLALACSLFFEITVASRCRLYFHCFGVSLLFVGNGGWGEFQEAGYCKRKLL